MQQQEIKLYEGSAPGSENWNWAEDRNDRNRANIMTVYNVVDPTLSVFLPDPAVTTGTAVIVCPGGGFHFLAIDHEGTTIAKELVKKGITVFVLKYRILHIFSDSPFEDMLTTEDPAAWNKESLPVIPLAIADGRQAIAYVRRHAEVYKIATDRIGIIGFSAGGLVAAATAFGYTPENRPDFVVPVYADIPEWIQGPVLANAPPLFLACTQDDEFGFVTHALKLYTKWYSAQRLVEMHLYTKGGHGFGIGNVVDTTYQWLDQLSRWLAVLGM